MRRFDSLSDTKLWGIAQTNSSSSSSSIWKNDDEDDDEKDFARSSAARVVRDFRAQNHLAPFPAFDADVVHLPHMVAPRHAVKRITSGPERNDVHAAFLRQRNRPLDRLRTVVPIEQKIFPLQNRRFQPARVPVFGDAFHRGERL